MKKRTKLAITGMIALVFLSGAFVGGRTLISNASGGDGTLVPGSVDDPLVTKSYLEERLRELTGQKPVTPPQAAPGANGVTEQAMQQAIAAEVNKLKQELFAQMQSGGNASGSQNGPSQGTGSAAPGGSVPSSGSPAGQAVEVLKLEPGQVLYAGAGTEMIVRTGRTVAVSTDENGIPDVTAGKDLAAGTEIETNHLLIFPREGRGIKSHPDNKTDIYVMIRGPYLLMKENQKQ
jgi:hypothetical protein